MKVIQNPNRQDWEALCTRPNIQSTQLNAIVKDIISHVEVEGDKALLEYAARFDEVQLDSLIVSEAEVQTAINAVPDKLKNAIQLAYRNILKFHSAQKVDSRKIETSPGVNCWRKSVPIEKVGLYIPGGSAPLFSTILMLGIPASIAGCQEVIMCTPPSKSQTIHPAILYTANLVGITKIYKVGGAQAIAAMAVGTESIPSVYKIFGPGNQYVTKAKELIMSYGVAIDMPAGPSEVLVIADKTANPSFVAADLLSQAEHGIDSQVILVSDDDSMIADCIVEVDRQLEALSRKVITRQALENSKCIRLNSLDDCFAFSNFYAPEHLIIASDNASEYVEKVLNAGSVFLGNYSCESAGDYASGTNHTLPTNGFAKAYSGVSLDSFVKKITFQNISPIGIQHIGPTIEIMAEAEELQAHKNAVTLRLNSLKI